MTAIEYVNIVENLNEKFLQSKECENEGWSFNFRNYGYVDAIHFNDQHLWDSENYDNYKTEEDLFNFCEKQYRDYITKLYRTLEL